jgi:hypothetical protein
VSVISDFNHRLVNRQILAKIPEIIFTQILSVTTGGVLRRLKEGRIDVTKLMDAFCSYFTEGFQKQNKTNVAHISTSLRLEPRKEATTHA